MHLLVFDGLRTRSVQKKLWDALDTIPISMRTQFVADPKKRSIHNYDEAVDLSLALENDSKLDMGIEYGHFGELTFPAIEDSLLDLGKLTNRGIENKRILRKKTTKTCFSAIDSEWW